MKHVRILVVVAFSGLFACGAKEDVSADHAATALQALLETKVRFDARGEEQIAVACADGGQVSGLPKGKERDRAARGMDFTVNLEQCENRGIVMAGAVVHENDDPSTPAGTRAVRRYHGVIALSGGVQGTCDLRLVEYDFNDATALPPREPSTFCGYDVRTLIGILDARSNASVQPVAPSVPPVAPVPVREPEDDGSVIDTADVAEVPDTDIIAEEADVSQVPDEQDGQDASRAGDTTP